MLRTGKLVRQKLFMPKKRANVRCSRIRISNTRVIGTKAHQQIFITYRKAGGRQRAVIPYNGNPAIGAEDARKFSSRRFRLEPMKSLAYGDEVSAGIRERSSFRGSVKVREVRIRSKVCFTGLAHFLIGLHAENLITI